MEGIRGAERNPDCHFAAQTRGSENEMTARPKIDSGIEEFANDLGKPWQWEEDGYTVTRGCAWSAPGCHPVGCGVKFYVNKDGILEKVEGDENQPITQGRLCVRCLTLPDFT